MITVNKVKQLKLFVEYDDSRIEEITFPINENVESVGFTDSPILQLINNDKYALKEEKVTIQIVYKNPLQL